METGQKKTITIVSLVLVVSLGIVSFCGAFVQQTYEREVLSLAVQGMGQDIVNLFIVVPLLILTLTGIHRENKRSYFIFTGILFYVVYSFFIYTLGIHFNALFLLYCLTLGTSLYLFILMIIELSRMEVQNGFSHQASVKPVAVFFIILAALFYALWLKDVVPAILKNTLPESVRDYQILVNPVHVLDMSIVLPGLIITSLLLFKKHKYGFVFAPVFLVFITVLAAALIGMAVMMKWKGINEDISVGIIFVLISIFSLIFLIKFFRALRI